MFYRFYKLNEKKKKKGNNCDYTITKKTIKHEKYNERVYNTIFYNIIV